MPIRKRPDVDPEFAKVLKILAAAEGKSIKNLTKDWLNNPRYFIDKHEDIFKQKRKK